MEEEKKKKTVWFLPIVEMTSFKEKPVYDLLYYVILLLLSVTNVYVL